MFITLRPLTRMLICLFLNLIVAAALFLQLHVCWSFLVCLCSSIRLFLIIMLDRQHFLDGRALIRRLILLLLLLDDNMPASRWMLPLFVHTYTEQNLPTSHRPQEVSGQCYFKNENETVNILPESNLLAPRYSPLGVLDGSFFWNRGSPTQGRREGPQNSITNTDN